MESRRATPDHGSKRVTPLSVIRHFFVALFGLVAALSLCVGAVAVWGRTTLFDSDRVAGAAAEGLATPGATAAIAEHLAAELSDVLNLEDRLDDLLPGALDNLAPSISGSATRFIQARLDSALRRDDVQETLVEIARDAHAHFLDLLENDVTSTGFRITDDEVSFNLLPLVTIGLRQVQELGLWGDTVVPEFAPDGDPAVQIPMLESLLSRDLPADFGQLVVFQGDAVSSASQEVETAQDILVLVKRATVAVIALFVGSVALAVLLSRRRRGVSCALGAAFTATLLATHLATRRVLDEVPDLVSNPGASDGLRAALKALSTTLDDVIIVLATASLIVASLAALTGSGWLARRLAALHPAVRLGLALVILTASISLFRLTVPTFGVILVLVVLGGWHLSSARHGRSPQGIQG
jgi:hypothetical protein